MEQIANIFENNAVAAPRGTITEMVVSRQAQEVQAAMVIAKKFPRNEFESFNRIMKACQRKGLAEKSMYEYPRGGERVTGPSIRLAEAMAQNWGNIDFGIIELEQRNGESQVMAYAWDLETNTRQAKIFSVPHVRESKKNGNVPLTAPRDIYEQVANYGARRLRACILGIIPGDVIEAAVAQCGKTLAGENGEPLEDTVRAIAGTFEREYGVTVAMLEKFMGCKIESFTMQNLIRLKKVYISLRDGMADREDYFDIAPAVDESEINRNPFEGKEEAGKDKKGKSRKSESQPIGTGRPAGDSARETGQAQQQDLDPPFVPDETQEPRFK
ncbi:MAG: hypothetical protein ACLUN9_06445 [Enterocloster aldenensis]